MPRSPPSASVAGVPRRCERSRRRLLVVCSAHAHAALPLISGRQVFRHLRRAAWHSVAQRGGGGSGSGGRWAGRPGRQTDWCCVSARCLPQSLGTQPSEKQVEPLAHPPPDPLHFVFDTIVFSASPANAPSSPRQPPGRPQQTPEQPSGCFPLLVHVLCSVLKMTPQTLDPTGLYKQ